MKNEFRNWSDVRVFLAVFREGSTLAASRKLGMAQPTVARRIEAIENEIGLTLFDRDTRGFKPTGCARQLIPLAEAIEGVVEGFSEKVRELAKPKPVRITAPGYFTNRVMEIFSEFTASHPSVEIEFAHSIRFLNLLEGEADIAIRVSDSDPDEKLICRKIGTEHTALFGAPSYAEEFGLPKSADELRGHRFVTFERADVRNFLHDWLVDHVSPDQITNSFSDLDLMHASIRTGHGLGLIHSRWADTNPAFIRCFGNIDELSRSVTMLIAPDAHRRPEVRAFTKFFAPRYASTFP